MTYQKFWMCQQTPSADMYDARGYLDAQRDEENGYRIFNHSDVEKLMYVAKYRKVGFTHEDITEIFQSDIRRSLRYFEQRKLEMDELLAHYKALSHLLKDDIQLMKRIEEYGSDWIQGDCSPLHYVLYQHKGKLCVEGGQGEALHRFMSTCPEFEYIYSFDKEDLEAHRLCYSEGVAANQLFTKAETYFSKPYVTIDGVALKSSDYTLSYYKDAELTEQITSKNKLTLTDQSDIATVYVKITGKGNYAAEGTYLTDSYQVYRKSAYKDFTKVRVTVVNDQGAKLGKADYTGKALEPKVKVEIKDGKTYRTLTEGTDYTVAYVSNINKGKATVVLDGCGEYDGSKTAYFIIGAKSVLGSFLR